MNERIPVFCVNLRKREDRRAHIVSEFENRVEFEFNVVDATEKPDGAEGLWITVKNIVRLAQKRNLSYLVVCEDDHYFTKSYAPGAIFNLIDQGSELDADILLGGISWFKTAVQVREQLFWIDRFSGLQFTVIYSRFFNSLLAADFKTSHAADFRISDLSAKKFVVFPFISAQKEFGYSDVTSGNNKLGYVSEIFEKTRQILGQLITVKQNYGKIPYLNLRSDDRVDQCQDFQLPVYIINLMERTDRLAHIKGQFLGKQEFDVEIIEACRDKIGAVGLWKSIIKIIELAIANDDDVIILCEDDHEFTDDYSSEFLFKNIIEASRAGCQLLSGGAGGFGQLVPLSPCRYWINPLLSTQFIIVYKPLFEKILKYKFKKSDTADSVLSMLTSNKMLMYPYISVQKDFGYSDVTDIHNKKLGLVDKMFNDSRLRVKKARDAYQRYKQL